MRDMFALLAVSVSRIGQEIAALVHVLIEAAGRHVRRRERGARRGRVVEISLVRPISEPRRRSGTVRLAKPVLVVLPMPGGDKPVGPSDRWRCHDGSEGGECEE